MESPELESHKADSPKEEPTKPVQTDEIPVTQNTPLNKGISGKPTSEPRLGDEYQAKVPDFGTFNHAQVKMAPGIPVVWASHRNKEEEHVPLPGMQEPSSAWSEYEKDMFLLALYIYGKRLHLVRRFLDGDNKSMGDVISYYYGGFYRTDWYKRYKMRHCVAGPRLFQGWRQDRILTYLMDSKPQESHDTIKEVFKSYNEERSSFEEFIVALKGVAGAQSLVEAIGIGRGKHDLTKVRSDPNRGRNQGQKNSDLPVGKEWSLLSVEEVVSFLTGNFRLGKTRSNDLFWEAVWPRLQINGWIVVHPRDHALTFLTPGINIFPQKHLIKGIHYFDSVTDLLSKVASDPDLLSVPSNDDMKNNNNNNNNNGGSGGCVHPVLRMNELGLIKFTVIDTSVVERDGIGCNMRALRSLPVDTFTTLRSPLYRTEIDGPDDSAADVVKSEPGPAGLKLAKKNATTDAKSKRKERSGSSKIKTEINENDWISPPPLSAELSSKPHSLEKKHDKKKETSADLNLPELTYTSDEYNEKEGNNSSNIRRHGTRNRPPTAKALESLALGFIGSSKRKDCEMKRCSRRPKRRARKSVEREINGSRENVTMAAAACVSPCGCSDDLNLIDHA